MLVGAAILNESLDVLVISCHASDTPALHRQAPSSLITVASSVINWASLSTTDLRSIFAFFNTSAFVQPLSGQGPSGRTIKQDTVYAFLANALRQHTLEISSIVLAISTLLFLLSSNRTHPMSWLRFGGLNRLSPFTRSQGSTTVSDADFSYITNEDLQRHAAQTEQAPDTDQGPQRDTDVVTLKDKRNEYSVHFPAYSIANGELRIKAIREAAAKKLNTDVRKIKLLHKGRNLKDDRLQARAEGLRSGSEILCSVQEDPNSLSDLEESEGDDAGLDSTKKKRNRNNRNRKKKTKQDDDDNTPLASPGQSRGAPAGTSAMDKLNALRATLSSYDQDIGVFLKNPPSETAKREFERKRLSETLLTQVLLKTDGVEIEGDAAARANRKELVRDVQQVLKTLDEAHGGQA